MEVVTPILTGLKEWVDRNPKLSETILAVVIGVTGL